MGVPLGMENLVNGRRVVARSARDRKFDSAPTRKVYGIQDGTRIDRRRRFLLLQHTLRYGYFPVPGTAVH